MRIRQHLILAIAIAASSAAFASEVTVHLSKDAGDVSGAVLYAFDDSSTYLNLTATTDANGVATFAIDEGVNAKFRYASNGTQLWSGVTASPSALEFVVPDDTVVSVTKGGAPVAGLAVYAYDVAGTYLSYSRTTDASGVARFSIATGQQVKFRVSDGGVHHWSAASASESAVGLIVPADSVVTVVLLQSKLDNPTC